MRRTALALLLLISGCYQSHQLGDPLPPPPDAPPADLCTSTGGHHETSCCDSHCGEPCALACVRTVCICPSASQIFDPAHGCVTSSMCGVHAG